MAAVTIILFMAWIIQGFRGFSSDSSESSASSESSVNYPTNITPIDAMIMKVKNVRCMALRGKNYIRSGTRRVRISAPAFKMSEVMPVNANLSERTGSLESRIGSAL